MKYLLTIATMLLIVKVLCFLAPLPQTNNDARAGPTGDAPMIYLLPALTWFLKTIATELIRILLRLALRGDGVE